MSAVGSGRSAIVLAFLGGFARLVDLAGVYQPPGIIEPAVAMYTDWKRVGDDFRAAIHASEDLLPATANAPERVEA